MGQRCVSKVENESIQIKIIHYPNYSRHYCADHPRHFHCKHNVDQEVLSGHGFHVNFHGPDYRNIQMSSALFVTFKMLTNPNTRST